MKAIIDIIKTLDIKGLERVNPTEIYNEGWMTRILVYYSVKKHIKLQSIDFGKIQNWTSEALISSPFVTASTNREGYTHADMALGDFTVDYEKRGELVVNKNAEVFGIIEAKIGSPLSAGTKHAPNYNQASRNIACIAHNTNANCQTFFFVAAPRHSLGKHDIAKMVNSDNVVVHISDRYCLSNMKPDRILLQKAASCKTGCITYEDWIDMFKPYCFYSKLKAFYQKCLKWNKLLT